MPERNTSNKTVRLFILGAVIVGLLVAWSWSGEGGFRAPTAEAVETTTTWTYPASGGIQAGPEATENTAIFIPAPCTNCYITRIVPDLVYQNDPDPTNHPNGTSANFNASGSHAIYLHHMVVVNSCNVNDRIFAAGNERTIWQAPSGYGYFWNCATGWHVNYHIHNNSTATRGVALKLEVTYRTGETLTAATPVNLDISNSGNGEYAIPEGYSDTHSGSGASGIANDWTSTVQGKILGMGGHVHDYGISVAAYNMELGDYICTSVAGYGSGSRYGPTSGGPGTAGHPAGANSQTLNQAYHEAGGSPDDRYHIQSMAGCTVTGATSYICVGDVIRLHAQYNNTSLFPIFDAMGIMAAIVDTSLPDSNSNGTIDACEDNDADGLRNSADNCPDWANPAQQMPTWTVMSGDTDCDGYHATAVFTPRASEADIGTVPTSHCAATGTIGDEPLANDAWPPDFNDNQLVNGADILHFNQAIGKPTTAPPIVIGGTSIPLSRFDLNNSEMVTGADVLQINPFFTKRCDTP